MGREKVNYKKICEERRRDYDALMSRNISLKQSIDLKDAEIKRLQIRNKQALIDALAKMIDANAHLVQFMAKIVEPGVF